MAAAARGAITRALPWVAVLILAVFAFTQLRARNDAQGRLVRLTDETRARTQAAHLSAAVPAPSPPGTDRAEDERTRALDDALATERREHAAAREALASSRREVEAARLQAERLEALRATQAARADALVARVAALDAKVEAQGLRLEQRAAAAAEAAEPRVNPVPGGAADAEVRRWLEDAGSGDADRVRYARACASNATPEQTTRLRALVGSAPERVRAAARIAGRLPDGEGVAALLADLYVLASSAERAAVLFDLGREALQKHAPPMLLRLLASGHDAALDALLREVAPGASAWSESDRSALRDHLLGLLDASETARRVVAARAFGLLGLRGGADRLVALLGHGAAGVRAAAAHALSRVGDLDTVRVPARRAVLPLLADADRAVRTAGVLLAEALLADRIPFDPGAPAADRARALEQVRLRLRD